MGKSMTVTTARARLLSLAKQMERNPAQEAITLTRKGKAVITLVPTELYEGILETMEILSDEKLMADLRKSIRQMEEGKLIPIERVKRRMGL